MDAAILILLVLAGFLLFDLAVVLWSVDSRDGFTSAEWERRRHWRDLNQ